jgi:hypothetical protein
MLSSFNDFFLNLNKQAPIIIIIVIIITRENFQTTKTAV